MSPAESATAPRPPRLEWLPPLLVGACAAVAAEVALSVLLYGGTGFVRSLTTILAVEGLAFGGGLWSAPSPTADVVDRLRRRWLLCLVSFLLAAVFGAAWSLVDTLAEGAVGQGVGLAILAALPLYASGSLLGGMRAVAESDPGGRLSGPGPAVAVGAALGFVLTGFLLPRAPMPASLLVSCLVMLSVGGMAYGGVLGSRTELEVKARRPAWGGDVRVEERRLPAEGIAIRELLEGEHVRRTLDLEATPTMPWDVAAWRSAMPDLDRPTRVLMVGAGASPAPHAILREHPLATVDVLERSAAVVELGREYFGTGLRVERDGRLTVEIGNLDDLIRPLRPTYDIVLVDTAALRPLGGVMGLSMASLDRLRQLARPGGPVLFGPDAPDAGLLERGSPS